MEAFHFPEHIPPLPPNAHTWDANVITGRQVLDNSYVRALQTLHQEDKNLHKGGKTSGDYIEINQNGKKAPKGVHPNKVRKSHRGKVNFTQRVPHHSKDMKNSAKWALLAEAYTDFFELIRVALEEYLPEDYQELSIYMEHLPLDASSPAYPFGGFVLNISACTWAHQKRLCLVVPFGSFKGGQLCLFETGFSFDLQLRDVLIFPSADLMHFNLHFQGQRGTLVLHSDRQGDGWIPLELLLAVASQVETEGAGVEREEEEEDDAGTGVIHNGIAGAVIVDDNEAIALIL
ncbi:hypothetical protein C8R43DRAFT_965246 [Mycena crocata]|nr:hypothetical protein C8R43DRAFT_965246 [Mycena crocata]